MTWLGPIIYPDLPERGHRYLRAFSAWVYEYVEPYDRDKPSTTSTTADGLHEIHDTRLRCEKGREAICRAWPGFWDPSPTADAPDGRPLSAQLKDAGADARAYGAARMGYLEGGVVPAHVLVRPVEAYVARQVALRDVEAHLAAHPVRVVEIDGVHVKAKRRNGVWERTTKVVHPTTPAEGAAALLEKVELEYVGKIPKMPEEYPQWRPTGDEAATLLLDTAAALTGVPVVASTPPPVRYAGARLIATPELVGLIPALANLEWCLSPDHEVRTPPARPEKAGGPGGKPRARAARGEINLSAELLELIPDFGGSAR